MKILRNSALVVVLAAVLLVASPPAIARVPAEDYSTIPPVSGLGIPRCTTRSIECVLRNCVLDGGHLRYCIAQAQQLEQ